MNDDDPAQWQRRCHAALEWQRTARGDGGPFYLPHAQSAAERAGQVRAIEWEQRISGYRIHIVPGEEFVAMNRELHRRCHVTVRPFRRDRF